MSTVDWPRWLTRVRSVVFGDRLGVALFLGSLCWFALTWRLGFFITDTFAIANTLVNVADGHLFIERIEYSLTLGSQPGLTMHDGRVYGRNYGQVYLALPVYLLLKASAVVFDLRIAVAGGFSLALLGFAHQIGGTLDRRPLAVGVGSLLAAGSFLLSLAWAAALPARWAGLLALQVSMMLAGAALAVTLYRLGSAVYDRRVGAALGVAVVAATPIGFWATIPKRHVLTAALATVTVSLFYASRDRTDRTGCLARGGAYVAAGFATAVHSVEGAVLLAGLVPLDLVTAPSNSRRDLAVVAGALVLGLIPFLVTNALISGNPLLAPRWIERFESGSIGPGGFVQTGAESGGNAASGTVGGANGTAEVANATGGTSGSSRSTPTDTPLGDTDGGGGIPILDAVLGFASTVIAGIWVAVGRLQSTVAVLFDPDRLYHVFVRSGRIPGLSYGKNDEAIIELTVLESMPLAGVTVLGFGTVAAWGRSRIGPWLRRVRDEPRDGLLAVWNARTDPVIATDLLVGVLVSGLTLMYLPSLPLFSQITVRYLVPTVPLWLYLLARVGPVRRTLLGAPLTAGMVYAGAVAVGGTIVVIVLTGMDPALGEAMQFHALVNLALTAVAIGTVAGSVDRPRLGAAGLGLAAAGTTVLLALLGLVYFPYGSSLLPLSERITEALPLL